MSIIDAPAMLREAALRVTRQRVAVLTMVANNPHSDIDTIATAVRRELGSLSTQTVYDVLRTLTEVGLVRRIEPAGSPARLRLVWAITTTTWYVVTAVGSPISTAWWVRLHAFTARIRRVSWSTKPR